MNSSASPSGLGGLLLGLGQSINPANTSVSTTLDDSVSDFSSVLNDYLPDESAAPQLTVNGQALPPHAQGLPPVAISLPELTSDFELTDEVSDTDAMGELLQQIGFGPVQVEAGSASLRSTLSDATSLPSSVPNGETQSALEAALGEGTAQELAMSNALATDVSDDTQPVLTPSALAQEGTDNDVLQAMAASQMTEGSFVRRTQESSAQMSAELAQTSVIAENEDDASSVLVNAQAPANAPLTTAMAMAMAAQEDVGNTAVLDGEMASVDLNALNQNTPSNTATNTLLPTSAPLMATSQAAVANSAANPAQPAMDPVLQGDERLAMNEDEAEWGGRLDARLLTMVADNVQTARIHLDPPELGSLEIKMQITQDQASIQVQTQTTQVRDLLDAHAQRLREALASQGIQLTEFDVREGGAEQQGFAQNEGQGEQGSSSSQDLNSSEDEMDAAVKVSSTNLLDTYA